MTTAISPNETHIVYDVGLALQCVVQTAQSGLGTTITAAAGSITSNLLAGNGYKLISFGVTSTQNGAINIQRYLDLAGTIAQGTASTASITANTPVVLNVTDGKPFQSYTVQITNTGGSTATLSNMILLLQSY